MSDARVYGYTTGTQYFADLRGGKIPEFPGCTYSSKVKEYEDRIGLHADGRTQASNKDQRKLLEFRELEAEWLIGFNAAANDALAKNSLYEIIRSVDLAAYSNFK